VAERRNGPIQSLASGFLSLLNLKNTGANPGTLNDSVQATVDIEQWYLRSGWQYLSSSVAQWPAAPAVGLITDGNFTVPDGKIRYVRNLTIYMTTLGNVAKGRACAQIQTPGAINPLILGEPDSDLRGAAVNAQWIVMQLSELWVPAGTRFGMLVQANEVLAVPLPTFWTMIYVDFPI